MMFDDNAPQSEIGIMKLALKKDKNTGCNDF